MTFSFFSSSCRLCLFSSFWCFVSRPSACSQRWSAAHVQPRRGTGSHVSGWTQGFCCPPLPSPVPLPQPPRPPPHGDQLRSDIICARHGIGQRQRWVWPKTLLLSVSAHRHQQPREPDVVPRGVRVPLFKPRLFLLLQRSFAAPSGGRHG